MADKPNKRASKFDTHLYGDSGDYGQTIGEADEREADMMAKMQAGRKRAVDPAGAQGIKQLIEETKLDGEGQDGVLGGLTAEQELFKSKRIVDREDQYHQGRLRRGRLLSPERKDFFGKQGEGKEQMAAPAAVG